jgi:hypothetical protein
MVMLAMVETPESAVDVALTLAVTGLAGAVYVVGFPLVVCVGLNVPQVPIGLHDQSTPAFDESPVTTAVSELPWFTSNEAGGTGLNVTPGTVIVVLPKTNLVLSAVDVAVIVTGFVDGTALGAV